MKISYILAMSVVVLMIAGISTAGANSGQTLACNGCHAYPPTTINITTDVTSTLTVSPGQAFKVNMTWTGGDPTAETEVNWPTDFTNIGLTRDNLLFNIDPQIPASVIASPSGTTNSTLTAPIAPGQYIVRVHAARGSNTTLGTNNTIQKETDFKDINIIVQAPPAGTNAPGITANPATSTVSDTPGASRTFSITANQTVNVTWSINGSQVQSDTSVTESNYTNTSAVQGTWNVTATASNENGTTTQVWTWNVSPVAPAGPPSIINISPTPPAPPPVPTITDTVGATRTFSITVNQTVNVIWLINGTQVQSDTSVTTSSYTNTSAALGTWNVTAVASNDNGEARQMWNWIVQPASSELASITVTPAQTSVTPGDIVNFTATPLDQSGNPINATITWSSSNITVGSIDVITGMFTAVEPGNATITATSGTITGTANVTVTAPVPALNTIVVTPSTTSVLPGTVVNFTATPLDQSGDPINATITWSSSDTAVGTISAINETTGMFTAVAPGNTTISATNGTITGTANITVVSTAVTAFGLKPDTTAALKGKMIKITITALSGINTQTLYNRTANITITADNASAVIKSPANVSFTNGTATITITSSVAQFVNVTAADENITGSTTVVFADRVFPLEKGWNLISIPNHANPSNVSQALQNIQYNAIFSFDPANTSFSTPTVIQPLFGYWINVTAANQSLGFIADTTTVSSPPQRNLYEGWNLIGVNANRNDDPAIDITAGDLFAGLENNQIGKYYSILVSYDKGVNNPETFSGEGLTNNIPLKQGHGYWLFINPLFNRPQNNLPWAGTGKLW